MSTLAEALETFGCSPRTNTDAGLQRAEDMGTGRLMEAGKSGDLARVFELGEALIVIRQARRDIELASMPNPAQQDDALVSEVVDAVEGRR